MHKATQTRQGIRGNITITEDAEGRNHVAAILHTTAATVYEKKTTGAGLPELHQAIKQAHNALNTF